VGEAREPAYAFGEAGRLLGIEFLRTWWTAAALTLDLLEGNAIRKDQRIFVAPTAVANHWFTVKEVSGGAVVDCAPLTRLAMQQRLADLLETSAPEPPAAFCPSCGEKIQPGARFCRACGYRLVA
jgi:ribosomal protein L32